MPGLSFHVRPRISCFLIIGQSIKRAIKFLDVPDLPAVDLLGWRHAAVRNYLIEFRRSNTNIGGGFLAADAAGRQRARKNIARLFQSADHSRNFPVVSSSTGRLSIFAIISLKIATPSLQDSWYIASSPIMRAHPKS